MTMKKGLHLFTLMALISLITPHAVAQKIYKTNVKYNSYECYYNIGSNTMKIVDYKNLDSSGESTFKITIYNNDLKSVWKEFTLKAPDGYQFCDGPINI